MPDNIFKKLPNFSKINFVTVRCNKVEYKILMKMEHFFRHLYFSKKWEKNIFFYSSIFYVMRMAHGLLSLYTFIFIHLSHFSPFVRHGCTPLMPRDFINILHAAFTCADPKSTKRYWLLHWIFTLLGSACLKAAHRHVGEINPRPPLCLEHFL